MSVTDKIYNHVRKRYLKEAEPNKYDFAKKIGVAVQTLQVESKRKTGAPTLHKMLERLEVIGVDPLELMKSVKKAGE